MLDQGPGTLAEEPEIVFECLRKVGSRGIEFFLTNSIPRSWRRANGWIKQESLGCESGNDNLGANGEPLFLVCEGYSGYIVRVRDEEFVQFAGRDGRIDNYGVDANRKKSVGDGDLEAVKEVAVSQGRIVVVDGRAWPK